MPRKVLLCFGDSNSGMPMPEISSYRGSWGERSCPSGATGWFGHTTFQLWGGHSTTELSSPQHNLRRQCLGVRWCYDATVERYWGTNDTRKRIKLALTIYRDFMQNFLSDFERRDNKTVCLLVRSQLSSLSFVQRTIYWDGGNGFVWRGRCRDWGTIATQISGLKKP